MYKLGGNSKLTYKQVHSAIVKAAKRPGSFVETGFFTNRTYLLTTKRTHSGTDQTWSLLGGLS